VPEVDLPGEHMRHADLGDEQADMRTEAPVDAAGDRRPVLVGDSSPGGAPRGRAEEDKRSTRVGGAKQASSGPVAEDMNSDPSEEEERREGVPADGRTFVKGERSWKRAKTPP